jgi:hypothetical protein
MKTIQKDTESKLIFRNAGIAMLFSALALIPFIWIATNYLILLSVSIGLLILPVLTGFLTWIRSIYSINKK